MRLCDFCGRNCEPGTGPAKNRIKGLNGPEDTVWCGRCKEGRTKWYEAFLPLSNDFLQAAILCDSHDLKRGNFESGWSREVLLDRIYDFGEMLKERGVTDFKDDCDCGCC